MDVQEFLNRRHTSVSAVAQALQSAFDLTDDDILILVGSLVDGIGTSTSDIDLILATSRNDITFNACMTDVAVVVNEALADVRVVSFDDLDELLQRFAVWSSSPRIPRRAFEFTTDERKLLHRLATGTVLHGQHSYNTRIGGALSDADLVRHKLDTARHLGSTYLIDLQGLFEDSRYPEMIPIAQELCNQAIDAMLCGWGVTNPNTKWRTTYLSALSPEWHRRMPNVMGRRSAKDAAFDIGRTPNQDDPEQVVSFVSRICAFARMAFLWSEDAVLRGMTKTRRWAPRRDSCPRDAALKVPVLHFDVDITVDDEGVWISRLNQSGSPQRILPEVLAVLVWGDGETTADQLKSSAASISSAFRFATAGGYCASLPTDSVLLDRVLHGPTTLPGRHDIPVKSHQPHQV